MRMLWTNKGLRVAKSSRRDLELALRYGKPPGEAIGTLACSDMGEAFGGDLGRE